MLRSSLLPGALGCPGVGTAVEQLCSLPVALEHWGSFVGYHILIARCVPSGQTNTLWYREYFLTQKYLFCPPQQWEIDLHTLLGSDCCRKKGQLWWDGCTHFLLSCCVGYNCFILLCSSKTISILLPRSNFVKNILKQILAFGLKYITCGKFYKQSWYLESGWGKAVILHKWKFRSLWGRADSGMDGDVSPDLGGEKVFGNWKKV